MCEHRTLFRVDDNLYNCINCDEEFVLDELDFGDVVCISGTYGQTIEKCTESNTRLVAGVVSNTSTIYMGNSRKYGYPIAVAGLVWTQVTNEGGQINPGDLLVSSSTPGHAMKNNDAQIGTLLGKAYDFCYEDECDILMFVALG